MISAEIRAHMRRLVLVEGWRIETVARRFGVHHSVVRRALRDDVAQATPRPPSALDPFKPFIVQRLTDWPELTATRHCGPQQVPGRDLRDAVLPDQALSLRALSRSRSPQQNDAHVLRSQSAAARGTKAGHTTERSPTGQTPARRVGYSCVKS